MLQRTKNSWRFFYHYNKPAGNKMSVHWRGKCHIVKDVICLTECESKWGNSYPQVKMQGFATSVKVEKGVAVIRGRS